MGVLDDIKRAGQEALDAEKAKETASAGAAGGAIADAAAPDPAAEAAPVPEAAAEAPADVTPEAPQAAAPAAAPERHRPAAHAAPKPAPPKPKAAEHKKRTYTVKSGDTLSAIGAHFGVSWQEIARVNRIPNPDLIYPGQVFVIPD